MIISKTPFRISFCGGGTDLREFYSHEPGAVTSTAIDKHMYITVNQKFDDGIRVSYSKTENVGKVDEIEHPLVREAMKVAGIMGGVEITSMADIHSRGTGLGSSSSFIVGLLNALFAYKGEHKSAEFLARKACEIEIDILKEHIGKQDQYIAAYGGFKHIAFNSDESVFVEPVICKPHVLKELQKNLLLFYTGISQRSHEVLHDQRKKSHINRNILLEMAELARKLSGTLNNGDIGQFGTLLHQNWVLKKKLSDGVSNMVIDSYYEKALKAGAAGGKLLGAGGRGFLLLCCNQDRQQEVCAALGNLRKVDFAFEPQGSRIIYVGD